MEAMYEKKECRWKLGMHEKNECRWKLCMKRRNADGSYA